MRRENAKKRVRILVVALLVVFAVAFVAVQLARPLPLPAVRTFPPATLSRVPGSVPAIPWPAQGETAINVEGVGNLGSAGGDAPVPIASLTKIMTAFVVLKDHPLTGLAPGPLLTVTPADVLTYMADAGSEQSVVTVAAGEQLSELAALQSLLLVSGNNMAQLLASWDSGSPGAFVSKMNREVGALGLRHTHFVGPSGYETGNVSTAGDLVRLTEAALQVPAFAAIVATPSATVPVAGLLENINYDLGHNGTFGVKTGFTDAAGGCYVFAARKEVGGASAFVVGAVLGQQGPSPLATALSTGDQLVSAAFASLHMSPVLRRGQTLGRVTAPWASSAPVVAGRGLTVLTVPGTRIRTQVHLQKLGRRIDRGAHVGQLSAWLDGRRFTVPLVASADLPGPSLLWRLGHL